MSSPAFPPTIEIIAIALGEMLFGLVYNALVTWAEEQDIYAPYISFSVAAGVAVTVAIPTALWWGREMHVWQWSVLMLVAFGCSGLVMIVGSIKREGDRKSAHRRRPWPTAAARARDEAVMELSNMAAEIAEDRKSAADVVHRIHQVIGTLKSV